MMYWTGVVTWACIGIAVIWFLVMSAKEFCQAWILCYRHITERFKAPYSWGHATKEAWLSLWQSGTTTGYSWQKPWDGKRYGTRDVIRMYREQKANKD